MEINRENVDKLTDDVQYLQDELEALKYVISEVPFMERPAGQLSILDMIAMIKHGQSEFYRPAVENMVNQNRRVAHADEDFKSTFKKDDFENIEVDYLINKIIKHRVSFVKFLKDIPLNQWEYSDDLQGQTKNLYKLISEMVQFERGQLKSVAERVLTLQDTSRMNK